MNMKPSIFIGSSSEALKLANSIKKELSRDFHVEIWNEHLFEIGEDTLSNLLRFIQCYDFAVLVLTGDDFTISRRKNFKSPRDNVVFELGLFMGALGKRRAFAVVAPAKANSVKMPSDLLGNTAVYLPKGFAKKSTPAALRTELSKLFETLKARSHESKLQLLPSTALAIGYFKNFILPVCNELAKRKVISIGSKRICLKHDNYSFTVVLPKTLSHASVAGAQRFSNIQRVSEFMLKTMSRSYPFYISSSLKAGNLQFFDYPTTLRASHECVRLALAGPYMGFGKHHAILEQREIQNFERTLKIMLELPDAVAFRDNVRIVKGK